MKMPSGTVGIGVILGIAAAATAALLGRSKIQTGYGRVRQSLRERGGTLWPYSHGGFIKDRKAKEKVSEPELP
ncbi:MAG: hypothetical protein ACLFTB_07200 [Desulfovibrionales bacterium]